MDLMVEKFYNLNLKDNEIYLLGDFNINLFQNDKYILNGNRSITCQGSVHTMINRYNEFCQIYSLKQLITCSTCVWRPIVANLNLNDQHNFKPHLNFIFGMKIKSKFTFQIDI